MAFELPVLFKSIIALSACHWYKVNNSVSDTGPLFHAACVEELLQPVDLSDPERQGGNLAATCLLRSYELISGRRAVLTEAFELTITRGPSRGESSTRCVLVRSQ